MPRNAPSNSDDVIDSRDVIRRIDELEGDLRTEFDSISEQNEAADTAAFEAWVASTADDSTAVFQDDAAELQILRALAEEGEASPDWQHGETLIRDDYFERYARDLADDMGVGGNDTAWPGRHIDWEAAAEELKHDYMSVSFDGVEYWIRA